jgi:predicted GNAT family acetyltransferase
MAWKMSGTVDEFLAVAGEFLRAERARNTVALTVTETLRVEPSVYADSVPLFGWWTDGSGVAGAFMQTPPYPAFLTAMTETIAAELADELAVARPELPGVNGEEPTAHAFANRWRQRTGTATSVRRRSRLFRLGELTWPEPMPDGRARLAVDTDRDLLIRWLDAFAADIGDSPQRHGRTVDARLSYGGFTFWEAGDQPVSLASVTRAVDGMVRVGPVYTPPEHRGRGYGGAATATVSRAALDAGIAEVLLYTDLANPTSNALYQRLGYLPVEDRIIVSFG